MLGHGSRAFSIGCAGWLTAKRQPIDRGQRELARHLLVRRRARLDELVGRRLVDRPRQQGYGGHLHVVRRERPAVAADVGPGVVSTHSVRLVDVAPDPPVDVPGPLRQRPQRRLHVRRGTCSRRPRRTRNRFTTITQLRPRRRDDAYARASADARLTMVLIALENRLLMRAPARATRLALRCSTCPASRCISAAASRRLAGVRAARDGRHHGRTGHGGDLVLPAAVRRPAGRRRRTPRSPT